LREAFSLLRSGKVIAMKQSIHALASMGAREKQSAIDELISAAQNGQTNGSAAALDRRIAAYETRYEMTSDEMRARFRDQKIPDTADIARWFVLLSARDRASR